MRKTEISIEGLKVLKEQAEQRRTERTLSGADQQRVAEAIREAGDRLAAAEAKEEG